MSEISIPCYQLTDEELRQFDGTGATHSTAFVADQVVYAGTGEFSDELFEVMYAEFIRNGRKMLTDADVDKLREKIEVRRG